MSRLAAVLVVGAIALGGATSASAADDDSDTDAAKADEPSVELGLSTGSGAGIAPGAPLLSTVTLANGTEAELSAGTVTVELNRAPLPDGTALDEWLDAGTAAGSFQTVATEQTPAVAASESAAVSIVVDAAELTDLAPGVYAITARLSDASTAEPDAGKHTWNLAAQSVLVISTRDARSAGVLVPITATPEDGALLTADELTELTAARGALTGQLDAVTGTSAILGVDPAIPTAIRMLGTRAPQSATDWLERLERLPNDVFLLQFADADPTTQVHAGQKSLLQPPELTPLLQPADFPPPATAAPTTTPTPSPTSTATEESEESELLPDNGELAEVLGAHSDILWPRADVSEADLAVFGDYLGDRVTTVLPSSAVAGGATSHSAVGARDLLVTDAPASARLSAAVEMTDPAAVDRELAGAAGHLFFATQTSASVLVGLDRSETRSPVALRAMLSAFGSPSTNLAALRTAPAASVSLSSEPDTARAAALGAMLADEQRVTAFASILDEPALLLAPNRIRLLRTIGVGASGEEFTERVAAQSERVRTTLGSVSIQQPKPVQLFTSAAPLPVWVRNDLPWTVHVSLHSRPSEPRLDIQPVTEVEALALSSTRIDVPIEARVASGDVRVAFRLTSPTDVAIGQPAAADVTLRADWEGIGLGILGGLIGVLFVFGVVRTVLRRRNQRAADAGAAAPIDESDPARADADTA